MPLIVSPIGRSARAVARPRPPLPSATTALVLGPGRDERTSVENDAGIRRVALEAGGAPGGSGRSWRREQTRLIVASQDVLFGDVPSSRCDACGVPIAEADEAEGYGIPGRGVYLWARGEDAHLESVPLCAACASAIGMTALARWEIEEEEG